MLKINYLIKGIIVWAISMPLFAMQPPAQQETMQDKIKYLVPVEVKNPETNTDAFEIIFEKRAYHGIDIYKATGVRPRPAGIYSIRRIVFPGEVVRIGYLAEIDSINIKGYEGAEPEIHPESTVNVSDKWQEVWERIRLAHRQEYAQALLSFSHLISFFNGRVFTLTVNSIFDVGTSLNPITNNVMHFADQPLSIAAAFPGLRRGKLIEINFKDLKQAQALAILGVPKEDFQATISDTRESVEQLGSRLAELFSYHGIDSTRAGQLLAIVNDALEVLEREPGSKK